MEFKYFIILCCLAFAVFLMLKEIGRNDKSRLLWRIIASIIMITSFALLIFPISYTIKKEEPVHELNLLTEGTSLDTASILKTKAYTLDSKWLAVRKKLKVNYLADLAYHLKAHPDIKKINVYGYGLTDQDLKMLDGYQISFHPAVIPPGVISASWQKKLSISETLIIQGCFHNPTKEAVKLKLYGMGSVLDSLTIKANAKVNFSFSTRPKQTGKAVFNLISLQGKDTLAVEPVPFEVASKQPISVLILASFPDFEYKFLKQWLYENQYPIAFRSQISKDKYSTEFLNRKPININRLIQTLLKDIDLMVIDEDELAAISGADKTAIYSAVNNGMGLIVRAAKLGVNEQPVITDSAGKIVVGSKLSGMGKILTTTLVSTYQWQLAGNKTNYASFWTRLFEKVSRKEIASQSFEISPKWSSVNEKSTLKVNLNDHKAPLVLMDSIPVYPRQNMELPFLWDGYFWPMKSGWSVVSINKKIAYIYNYKETDWQAAKNFDKLNSTLNFESAQLNSALRADKIEYLATEEINKWWFFFLFMLAISFLWYEQRFLANK